MSLGSIIKEPDESPLYFLGEPLRLKGLSKYYGQVTAVQDFSMDIEAGEFITILGPSGSGKTTVLQMIAGFVSPSSGEIIVGQESVTRIPPYKRNIGLVFQNYALFPHLRIFDNIAFPLRMRGMSKSLIKNKVKEVLQLVHLEGFESRWPHQISGGQQQRVALARALVFRPPVLLMDEPFSALDKALRDHLRAQLKAVQTELGVTVVFVTHDQQEALVLSDRVAIMKQGKLRQIGSPEEIYNTPIDKFVATFLGDARLLQGTVIEVYEGMVKVNLSSEMTVIARASGSEIVGSQVTVMVRPEKLHLTAVKDRNSRMKGRVLQTVYEGNLTRYKIEITGGRTLNVQDMNASSNNPVQPGSEVGLAWEDGAFCLLRE